eukprot:GHRQ01019590.1.p3 GENE.GHRQ01019590.1~~GHRQ01019590.1.p3  ORF type:complete len:108 (+),score=49.79 GHRQ01019590.1:178-501(+)
MLQPSNPAFTPRLASALLCCVTVQGKYLRSALLHAHLRPSLKLHLGAGLAGMAAFAYEDVAHGMRWPPVLHSLWHCLSAVAMGCFNNLLQHVELAVVLEGVQTVACS